MACDHTTGTCTTDGTVWYCIECLWAATDDIPTEYTHVDRLYLNSLGPGYGWNRITPEVISRYAESRGLTERLLTTDTSVPVLVTQTDRGLEVLQGRFRVAKLLLDGLKFVPTIEIPADVITACVR